MARKFMLFSVLLFIFVLTWLTVREIQVSGVNVLVILSFVFIGAAGVGLVGALTGGSGGD
jgi:hypothetical protein